MATPIYGWPTFEGTDEPNFPEQSEAQLLAIEATLKPTGDFVARLPWVQSGMVAVTATNGIGSTYVQFAEAFPSRPVIIVEPHTSTTGVVRNVQFNNPTAQGFDMVLQRSSSTATNCSWIAVWVEGWED